MTLLCAALVAQEATDIYLFDLTEQDDQITISNPINITNNPGYDNQPSFTEDGMGILFSSFRDGQADISKYFLDENYRVWLTDTPASEFSPVAVPGKKKYFTCVRLNKDKTQYVYKYAYKKKEPVVLIPDLKVGYYLWIDQKTLATFVIDDIETLEVSNFKYKIKYPIAKNIGRSIENIPFSAGLGSRKISYISLEHGSPEIYAIDPSDSTEKYITDPLVGSQDLAWTNKGTILMGNEDGIFKFTPGKSKDWTPVKIESELLLTGFSRLALSPDGKKLAVVVLD